MVTRTVTGNEGYASIFWCGLSFFTRDKHPGTCSDLCVGTARMVIRHSALNLTALYVQNSFTATNGHLAFPLQHHPLASKFVTTSTLRQGDGVFFWNVREWYKNESFLRG